ncbi:MAG: VWA domain-containing protein [Lentisphaeria bacterium]|nr:VWA domain-containing protein [Lentisphaeria bacterium]
MKLNSATKFALSVALLLSAPLFACRIIVPPWPPPWPPPPRPIPPPPRPPAPMEVREHRARIDVRRHVADTTVEATFHNPNPFRIEGVYVFPIAPDASVSSFTMTANGKTLEAELLDAAQARKIYEDIVRRLKDPALLEYAGEGLLRARVYPIEPHSEIRIQLAYEMALRSDGGLVRVRYPLLSAKPDGGGRVGKARIEVRIDAEADLKSLFVPGFQVKIDRDGNRRATVTWQEDNMVPDRDFELLFSEDQRRIGVDFLGYRDGEDGFFLMLVAPDSELQAEQVGAKDITFVIDTSGSMMGDKIRQARDALTFCVQALNPDDTFNIVAFATDVTRFQDASVPATAENRNQARDFIAGLGARGGTAIERALQTAFEPAAPRDRPSFVVFITDGLPTVGETKPEAILKTARDRAGDRRLFAFGVGYDVNTRLLDGICDGTRGTSSYVRPQEDLEIALSSFYEKIAHPVMTELRLETGDVRLTEIHPPDLPDLFRGSELRLLGRYRGQGRRDMALSGSVGGTRETFRFEADLDGNRRNTFLPRMWAVSRVGYLQDQIRIHGPDKELVEEIRHLGRTYGILTEYTSFLIVEDQVDHARVGDARRAFREAEAQMYQLQSGAVAVESAARSKAMQADAALGAGPAPMAMPAGEAGAAMRTVVRAAGLDSENLGDVVRHAGAKTFYLRRVDGFWYDSLVPAGSTPRIDREVTAYSDAFFELAARYPDLHRYLQIATKLVLVLDGTTVRIQP